MKLDRNVVYKVAFPANQDAFAQYYPFGYPRLVPDVAHFRNDSGPMAAFSPCWILPSEHTWRLDISATNSSQVSSRFDYFAG